MVLTFRPWFRFLVHILCLAPFILMVADGVSGNLSANPIQALTQRTGLTALTILLISLAATPLQTYLGFQAARKARRALGLYAFFYAALHVSIFIVLDYGANFNLIWLDISNKRYILVGASAFLILFALAVTSFRFWKVRLGKKWKKLHRLVYLAALLVVIHYIWAVKADIRGPLIYLLALGLLMLLRLPIVKQRLSGLSLGLVSKLRNDRRPS